MSIELMVRTKGLFIAAIVPIALVVVSLAALILVSGWLRLVVVLTAGFWLPLCFLLFKFSIVFKKVIDVFSHGV
jgi:hypothetical protein